MNGDGNPIVKARCAAVAVFVLCEKETHVTEKKCVPYHGPYVEFVPGFFDIKY